MKLEITSEQVGILQALLDRYLEIIKLRLSDPLYKETMSRHLPFYWRFN